MNRKNVWAGLGAALVNVAWGLSFIASKIAMTNGFSPFALVLTRYVITCAMLFPILWRKQGLHLSRKLIAPMFLCSLTGITLYFFFELNGINMTSASTASLIIAFVPILQLLCNVVFHHARYRAVTWLGMGCSMVGVYLLVAYGASGGGKALGYLCMMGACLCWVSYHEVTERLLQAHDSLYVTCWPSLCAMLTLIPCACVEGCDVTAIAPMAWAAAAFLGIVCSALGYILYNNSIRVLSPARTALFLNLNPVAGCLGGVLILGERLTLAQGIGGVIILASILWVNRSIATRS